MAELRIGLDEITCHFADLHDPRSSVDRLHPFVSVVVLALMGVLAGATGPTLIARWAKFKKPFLERVLDLPHGVPGKDVLRRVLGLLEPAAFQASFASWLDALRIAAAAETAIEQPMRGQGDSGRWPWVSMGCLRKKRTARGRFAVTLAQFSPPATARR